MPDVSDGDWIRVELLDPDDRHRAPAGRVGDRLSADDPVEAFKVLKHENVLTVNERPGASLSSWMGPA